MSEQIAMQPDEFDSTNERLDSILDRLNALGESAAEMKIAPLRPLQSVPDLDPAVADAAPDLPVMNPPAIPQLDLVPPTTAPQVEISPAADAPAAAVPQPEAPAASTVVETPVVSEPIQAHTVIDAPVAEMPAVQAAAVDTPATELPEASWPVVEATPAAPAGPDPSWPVVEAAAVDAQIAESHVVEPTATDVEFHTPDFDTSNPSEELADSILEIVESDQGPLVFDLEPGNTIENAPVDTPDAPTSIFASSLSGGLTPEAPVDPSSGETDGWVSYHESESQQSSVIEESELLEAPEFVSPETDELAVEMISEIAEEPVDDFFAVDTSSAVDTSIATPEVVDHTIEGESFDAFAAIAESDEAVSIAGIDSPLADADNPDLYGSDEELPLPDFTGVYAESIDEDGFWGDADTNVPDPVETGFSPMSIARDELDKLRPDDDDEVIVEEKSSASRTVKLQFFLVLMFGLIVLAFVLGDDPQVIDDMRDSISNLIG